VKLLSKLTTKNIVPISAIIEPTIFFISVDSFKIKKASRIVNIGPEVCIILLTDAVVYIIPIFCKIPGKIIVKILIPRKINQSSIFVGILFLPYLSSRNINIGKKTIDLIAARVIGGTPLSNADLMSGNEKDHIMIAHSTPIK
jgi:hypothetical protein